ncbi:MarR family transcriptional regulator [Rathayibacter sp. VKM Ac-2754]|nr:MarR family transcriptional regulator [Rathayibacter sp. VKM Ac-2754]
MTMRVTAALRVVRLLGERPDPTIPLAVGAIAEALGAPLSGTSRLCAELERSGLIERGPAYGSYRLGRAAVRLSGRAAAPFARTLRFALTLAAQQTGETVVLAAGSAPSPRVVAGITSSWTLHAPAEVGEAITDESSAIALAGDGRGAPSESASGGSVEIATPLLTPAGECVAVLAARLPANRLAENGPRIRRALAVARTSIEARLGEPGAVRAAAEAVPAPSAIGAALRLLQHLADGPDTAAGASAAAGLRRDRAVRLLDSCVRAGLVTSTAGEYRLGWIVHGWSRAATAALLVDGGGPLVAETARRLGACGFITVLAGMRSLTVVEELQPPGAGLAMIPWLGRAHPIVGSDGGPTMLMDLEEDELGLLFPARHTPRELARLLRRRQRARRDGVLTMEAYDAAGMTSVSAPIRDASGAVVAAACLVGITEDVHARRADFERAAVELAAGVTGLLG